MTEATPPVVFFHVMKCGGTSLRAALKADRGDDVFELDGAAAVRAVGGILAQDANWRFRTQLLAYLLHAGPPAVTMGHWRFDTTAHSPLLDTAAFVTVLRDPVERVVSLYHYRQGSGRDGVRVVAPLAETIEDPAWQRAGCHYVELFCGRTDLDPRSQEAVEAAVANLHRFALVGRLDDLGTFSSELEAIVARPVRIDHRNRSPADADEVADEVADALPRLRELCGPDQAVFDAFFAR